MKRFYTGIDIGTYHVKVVIAVPAGEDGSTLRIIGTGTASSKGLRHGYIVNAKEAAQSISEAVRHASEASKAKVTSARIAVGGVGIDEMKARGEVTLTASGGEVTQKDMDRAIAESERKNSTQLVNKKVVHAIPLVWYVDGAPVLGRPVGLQGSKLAVETLLITALEQHLQDTIDAVEAAGIEVEDVMVSPLAASLVTLTKPQKMAGVVLANIGAETVSIAVFENDMPISVKVLPTGSSDITNDIALSLQIPLTEAEQMKRGAITKTDVSRKKVDGVVSSRLKDIFNIIDVHLKSIDRQRLLPAGMVITGGGSGVVGAADIARATMRLPSQVASMSAPSRTATADSTWSVAYGLTKWGYTTDQKETPHSVGDVFSHIGSAIGRAFKALLP